ncbi:MAG TPA: heavy metal-responsive transcriptional regulator [Blastocatellia bacterium]|nr:heavy metal-responsive transcriptional regulator [Blastocatellia bacterium]
MPLVNVKSNSEPVDPMKIGEVSKRSGVSIETLRFYEKRGLLGRTARTSSGYRLYDQSVIDRLSFIKRAQTLGFSLDEIVALIKIKSEGHSPCEEVRALVRDKIKEVDRHIADLIEYRDELKKNLRQWQRLGAVEGHVCGLIEGMGPGLPHNAQKSKKAAK